MRNKLILFLMLALFGSVGFLRADEVTIGDPTGTTVNSYLPLNSLYDYSFTEQIYTAAEIGFASGGTINSVTMWLKTTSSNPARHFEMYMVETTKDEFSGVSDWVTVTAADLVYDGTVTPSADIAPYVFTLTTPFDYHGGNLLIAVNNINGNWSSGFNGLVFGETTDPVRAIYARRDGTPYDISALPNADGVTYQKNVIRLDITPGGILPPPPPTPTGELTITPNPIVMGDRPTVTTWGDDAWMEPMTVRIANGSSVATHIEAVVTNGSTLEPFFLEGAPVVADLEPDDAIELVITINHTLPDGDYSEELVVSYSEGAKSIVQIPLSAKFYSPVEADVVEDYGTIADPTLATLNPTGMVANYNLKEMEAMQPDAIYYFELTDDATFHVDMDKEGYIYVFNYVAAVDFHPTPLTEPVVMVKSATPAIDQMMLKGQYYIVFAAEELNTATINMNATYITAAPTVLTNIAPANSATEVVAPVTLQWQNDPEATQYQVFFGTTYPPAMVLDWTPVQGIDGSYVVDVLDNNTQYFWQIKNKNSLGEVPGEMWGFTTPLQPVTGVEIVDPQIFTDGSTLIKWRPFNTGAGFNGEVTVADGTTTNSYVPLYGLWVDDYTRSETIYPEAMLSEMIGGEINTLKYYISSPATGSWAPATFRVYMKEVSSTTLSGAYLGSADATIVYEGALDGTGSVMTINLTNPYTYNGGNLLIGIEEPTEGTYHSCSFYGITSTGSSASGYSSSSLAAVTFTQRDFIPKTTFVCGTGAKSVANNRAFKGYNVYYNGVQVNTSLVTDRQFLLDAANMPGGEIPYSMPGGYDVHVRNVFDEGESPDDAGTQKLYVSGYGYLEGTVTELNSGDPMANVTLTFIGKDEFDNDVDYTTTSNALGQYQIKVKDGNYTRGYASLPGFENTNGNPIPAVVTEKNHTVVDFVMHEKYNPIFKVYAQELDPSTAKVTWSLYDFVPGMPGVTSGDEFSVDFESGVLPTGWTTIDADGDGNNWMFGSAAMGAGYGHNASNDLILSQSYSNSYGALTPDNYLVTPQVNIGPSSTFSFWACAQDNAWASEHYGVAISTTTPTATAFTTIQEWTMTAKDDGTPKGPRGTNTQGTWYQKTVDLSAYAGQNIYIAIRHFNCTDMFYLDVDDIALSNGTKGGRALDHYTVVRKALLKQTPIVMPDDSVYLATLNDTLYADFDWDNMAPGLYQYGVRSVYPGGDPMKSNRVGDELTVHDGTATSSYVPVYGFYTDAYLKCQYIMTEDLLTEMVGGTINGMTFYLNSPAAASWGSADFEVYLMPYANTTISAYDPLTAATKVYQGPLDGTQPTMTVDFSTPYTYTGGNLLVAVYNVNKGTYKSCSFYGENVTGACVQGYSYNSIGECSTNQRNFVPKTTFHYDASAGGAADDPTTVFTWSNILPKDMDATLTVNAVITTGTVEGASVKIENVNAETFGEEYVFEAELDETGTVTFSDFRKGQYSVSVLLDGFTSEYNETIVDFWGDENTITAHFNEDLAAVPALTVSGTGYARWTDIIPATDVPERYIVKLEEVFQGETTDNYMQLDVNGLEAGHNYEAAVAVVYTTGMSTWTTANFTYLGCDAVTSDVDTLWIEWDEAQVMDVVLNWNEGTVTPPPPPPTTGWTEGFESGIPSGWTVIDANSDGYTWTATSAIPSTWTYYSSVSLDWYHAGTNAVCSGSYINGVGALNPDEYIVTPQVTPVAGSTFSFYAAACDAGYPADHYGVAISTTTPTASAFTTIQEWTMTAKESTANGGRASRDGEGAKLGTWYQKSVDLSAYAGQPIYIAIRHFNCYDQYILCVDDIEYSQPAKRSDETVESAGTNIAVEPSDAMWDYLNAFDCTSGYQYGVATDGNYIYTSSWSASSSSMFYKYDMNGNFVEEFNVSGCGQIRDLTYDGTYFYGVANASNVYCIDLANHSLVSTFSSAYGAMRCITYDPVNDGFWVVGNWSGALTLIDRTGAVQFAGPTPSSASGIAYYKDDENVEHIYLFCQPSSDAKVFDYNITTNTLGTSPVCDLGMMPGYNAGISGGAFVGNYEGKACFFGDLQQSPNRIGIYELGAASGGGTVTGTNITPNKFNIFVDGEVVGATADNTFTVTAEDYITHRYEVVWVDGDYNFSCGKFIDFAVPTTTDVISNEVVNRIYPNPTSGDLHIEANDMMRISVVNALGQVVYDAKMSGNETVLNMSRFNAGVYMVSVVTKNGTSVKRVVVTK